ncbi:hypothetical protein A9Q74_03670 [Colwellia sp. 39_35_sub15_T18]|nr:hypothetical protein A9Q74_03670 [Colwellia sp. 39_35_sub15_T18]
MRIFVSYLVVVLIALQSVLSIPDTATTHQSSHQASHQESDHHSAVELASLYTQLESADNSHANHNEADDHPDCHQSHCHHGAIVFVELEAPYAFAKQMVSQLSLAERFFVSYFISPDLRPPIV